MYYIGNALSAGMLDVNCGVIITHLTEKEAIQFVRVFDPVSCVGHEDTALLISSILGVNIPKRRESTTLIPGDSLLVAQYNGPRLPEGATALPNGAKIRWILVQIQPFVSIFIEGGALSIAHEEDAPLDRPSYTVVLK